MQHAKQSSRWSGSAPWSPPSWTLVEYIPREASSQLQFKSELPPDELLTLTPYAGNEFVRLYLRSHCFGQLGISSRLTTTVWWSTHITADAAPSHPSISCSILTLTVNLTTSRSHLLLPELKCYTEILVNIHRLKRVEKKHLTNHLTSVIWHMKSGNGIRSLPHLIGLLRLRIVITLMRLPRWREKVFMFCL